MNSKQLNQLQHIYLNLGWDPQYIEQDMRNWNNPNNLDLVHELIVLTHWTKLNMWRRYTQADYRMRFQSWLYRTKREQTPPMVKVEPKKYEVSDPELYKQFPDLNEDWEAFENAVVQEYKNGNIDIEDVPQNDQYIRGIIMLVDMGHFNGI